MKPRRKWLAALALGTLLLTEAAHAEEARSVHLIGHLSGSREHLPYLNAFRDGMRALGYVEGQNLAIESRYAGGDANRLAALADELVRLRPQVLVVGTTPAILAAKAATRTIPIVMVAVADPIGAGIVTNLARPDGNVTGVTNIIAELAGKRLEILKEIVPAASRIAVLINPGNANAVPQMRSAESAAARLRIELGPVLSVRAPDDLKRAFEMAKRARAGGAIRMIDPMVLMLRRTTIALAAQYRLPVIYTHREDVEAGGLVSYGSNLSNQYRQAASFVDKILKGTRPADLPVEQPTRFELVVNRKAANALGITIPKSVLLRADEVIE